jgi:hypothetical protein
LLLGGCFGHQPHPTLDELRDVPQASLHPPGATLVRAGGSDSDSKLGDNAAVLVDLYAARTDATQVLDYYRSHLGDGWREDPNAGTRATEWGRSTAWESDTYVLQVGIVTSAYQQRVAQAYPQTAGAATVFEVQLQKRTGS